MKLPTFLLFVSLSCCLCVQLRKNWWKNSDIYDISIWMFKDSDADGFGDLNGVTSKLDYIKELGIDTIKLSPVASSMQGIHTKYGIIDFEKIHLTIGTMEDFENLIRTANAKGINVILDFLINHCSTSHEWFKKSRRRIEPYTDYFIWSDRDGVTKDDSNWKWDPIRKQSYYHYYQDNVADLNLKNPAVKEEVKKFIKFWLDKGVSGLNLVSAHVYMENDDFAEDESESYEFVHELREFMDAYNEENDGYERVILLEDRQIEGIPNLHGNETYSIAQIVSYHPTEVLRGFYLTYIKPSNLHAAIRDILKRPNGPLLLVSEEDNDLRLTNTFSANKQIIDVWLTVAFMLPVMIHIFNGQEIGVSDYISEEYEEMEQRPFSSAMAWDDSLDAGFTGSKFSLIFPSIDSWENNVESMTNKKYSKYNLVKGLLQLRKTDAIKNGNFETVFISDLIYAFKRSYKNEQYIVLMNMGNTDNIFDLKQLWKNQAPKSIRVVASTPNSVYHEGHTIETKSPVRMRPTSSMVFSIGL